MADGASIELATVYINLVPSLKGAPAAIASAVTGAATQKASAQLGTQMVAGITKAFKAASGIPSVMAGAASGIAAGFRAAQRAAGDAAKAVALVGRAFSETRGIAAGAATAVSTVWQGSLNRLAPHAVKAVNAVRSAVSDGMGRVSSAVGTGVSKVSSMWATATAPVTAAWNRAASAVSSTWSTMTAPARAAFSNVTAMAQTAGNRVSQGLTSALSAAGGVAQKAVAPVASAFRYVVGNVTSTQTVIGNALGGIQRTWSSAWSKMPASVQNAIGGIPGRIGSALSGVGGLVGKGMAGAVNAAASAASNIGSAISGGISVGVKAAGIAMAAFAGVVTTNLGGAVQRADQLHTFPQVMANIGFSSEEAAQQIKRISSSLDGLPTSTDSVVRLAQSLAPLTGNLTSATDVSLALNDALLAGGASGDLAANAMEQYRQMLSGGTVDMAAWRSMVNAMPGQMDMIAKSILGAEGNTNLLYDAMKKGNVSFDQFNAALLDLDANGMEGFASFQVQARTATEGIGTAMDNAGNRVRKAIASIIDAIGVDVISGKLNELTSGITGFGDKIAGFFTRVKTGIGFEAFGQTLSGLLPVIGGLVGALGPLLTQIPILGGLFSGLTGPVGIVIGLFAAIMTHSELLRDTLDAAFDQIGAALTGPAVQGALTSLSASLAAVAAQIGGALAAAVAVLAPILADMAQTLLPAIATTIGVVAQALAPIAETIITTIAQVLAQILPTLTSLAATILPALGGLISTLAAALTPVINQVAGILVQAVTSLMPLLTQIVQAIMPVIVNLVTALAPLIAQVLSVVMNLVSAVLPVLVSVLSAVLPVMQQIITAVLPVVVPLIQAIIQVVSQVIQILSAILVPVIKALAAIVVPVIQVIGNIFLWLWNNIVSPVVGWITDKLNSLSTFMSGTLAPAISTAIDTVKDIFDSVKTKATDIADGVKSAFETMKDGIDTVWSGIKGIAARPVNFMIETVYTNGVKKLADGISEKLGLDFRMPSIAKIPGYASGGVLPGYTPGRDVYHFVSPDGGGRLALSGGEAIMRPEWVRAVGGARAVDAMNAAAVGGRRIPGGDRGRYAGGGLWDRVWNGVSDGVSAVTGWLSDAADAVSSIISDPVGAVANLVRKPVEALVNQIPGSGFVVDTMKSLPLKWVDGFAEWLKGSTATMSASDLVSQARLAIGTPYVWGGVSVPGGVDCSGLIVWALRQMGHNVPRHTASTFQAASTPGNANTPGNLLFWGGSVGSGGAHHVAVASGNGMMVEAPTFGVPVREIGIYGGPSAGVFKYDDGGWLQPGLHTVLNATGEPEAVATASQWDKIDRLVEALDNGGLWPRALEVRDVDGVLIGRMRVEADAAVDRVARDLAGRRRGGAR